MGQKRFVAIDLSQEGEQQAPPKPFTPKRSSSGPKPPKSPKEPTPVLSKSGKDISHLVEEAPSVPSPKSSVPSVIPKTIQKKSRSRRYQHARSLVDRTKNYPLSQAIELLQKTSITHFDGSVEAHLTVIETGLKAEIPFPHATGRTTKVAIADDKVLEDISAGKFDFDVLLSTPDMMPKLAKLAKILGPKGLMPNPKSGTITPDPEKKKAEMEAGKTLVRTEPKAPLVHVVVGKVSMKPEALVANITALINGLAPRNLLKLTLSSTMGPGIKVDLSEFKA